MPHFLLWENNEKGRSTLRAVFKVTFLSNKEIEIRCLDYIHNVAKRENQRKNQNQALKQNGDVQNWHLDFQVLGPKSAVVWIWNEKLKLRFPDICVIGLLQVIQSIYNG